MCFWQHLFSLCPLWRLIALRGSGTSFRSASFSLSIHAEWQLFDLCNRLFLKSAMTILTQALCHIVCDHLNFIIFSYYGFWCFKGYKEISFVVQMAKIRTGWLMCGQRKYPGNDYIRCTTNLPSLLSKWEVVAEDRSSRMRPFVIIRPINIMAGWLNSIGTGQKKLCDVKRRALLSFNLKIIQSGQNDWGSLYWSPRR